jgi:gamma-tubulin complex component 5
MDSHQQWHDFHFLNSAFAGVVEAQRTKWVETALVRLAYRGSREKSVSRTVRAIDGLTVEYAVPFPLTYIFTPRVLQAYGSIFVFLLQVRRAKANLERFLLRGAVADALQHSKAFYAMRSRSSWFIKCVYSYFKIRLGHLAHGFASTLVNFLTTYVLFFFPAHDYFLFNWHRSFIPKS